MSVIVDSQTLPLDNPHFDAQTLLENTGSNTLAYDVSVRQKFQMATEVLKHFWYQVLELLRCCLFMDVWKS